MSNNPRALVKKMLPHVREGVTLKGKFTIFLSLHEIMHVRLESNLFILLANFQSGILYDKISGHYQPFLRHIAETKDVQYLVWKGDNLSSLV